MQSGSERKLLLMSSGRKMIVSLLLLGLLCTGCGSGDGAKSKGGQSTNAVEAVIDQQIAADKASKTEEADTAATEKAVVEEPTTEEAPTEKPTAEQTTTETASTSAAANDRYDPFEGIDQEYVSDPDPSVDYDLTAMSREMVYATVLQMMNVPEDYVGKTVKMSGAYYCTYYDVTQQYYHYVIIRDALACCAQGMEFVWDSGNHDISEYPTEASEVEVKGKFEAYHDPGDPTTYVHLIDSSMEVLMEAEEGNTELDGLQ